MKRRYFVARWGAGIGLFTGCLENDPSSGGPGETPPSEESPTERQSTETISAGRDSERNASPHEFVYVAKVQDQTEVGTADANETQAFQNLSARRRQTFLAALDGERVAADGWNHYNESRPTYVRYNGTWYNVIVGVH